MSRSPRDLLFKKTDIVRAFEAARSAGITHPRIEITKQGTITIIPGEPPKDNGAPPASGKNPWDEVLTDAADEKRSA